MDNNWIVMLLAFGLAGMICIFIAGMFVVLVIFFVRQARSTVRACYELA